MSRGRNRPTGPDDTHDGGPGQPARHPAGLTALTTAGEPIHAPVCAGVEEARPGAKPRHSPRHLCRRSCDPVPTGQCREGAASPARDHGQAEADSERREDTDLQGSGRGVRLLGLYVRADVLSNNWPGPVGLLAVKEEHQAHGRKGPRADRPSGELARDHRARRHVEPRALRVGQLLQCRYHPQSLSRARQLHGCAVAPVAPIQAQGQATQGRELSTLAPLRALPARTPYTAWSGSVVGEGVTSCPRAGCGKSACPVVCPSKAGMFSRRQTCRGRSQSPVVWIAEVMETETLKPIDKVSPGEATSHRAVIKVNAMWPRE